MFCFCLVMVTYIPMKNTCKNSLIECKKKICVTYILNFF